MKWKNNINFALALKELRKSKDITLEQISDSTNIKIKYLQKIESGDFTFKSDVYVKLFLKEYLKYIDFEKSDKILQEFNNLFSSSPEIDLTFMPMNEDEDIELNENTFDINEYDPKNCHNYCDSYFDHSSLSIFYTYPIN